MVGDPLRLATDLTRGVNANASGSDGVCGTPRTLLIVK